MKKLFRSLLLASTLLLSGCKADSPLNIEFNYFTPTAYVGEEYDFTEVLTVEKGVKYKLEVYVCDYLTMTEKVLEVRDDFFFTPLELFDLSVVVTATKGGQTDVKTKPVPVSLTGDPIDELLVTTGYSGFADNGINKELVIDEVYLHGENSKSAIYASFQSSNVYTWGATIMSLNNFRLLDHWSDKTWENAVIRFWVFNPNKEHNLEFQLRIVDDYTKTVDVDWGNSLNLTQVAEPEKWTEILFSLRRYGVDHTLYENEEGTRHDSLNVKIKYPDAPKNGDTYSYQLYIDDIDIVPYSKEAFPDDFDTKCYAKAETLEYGWENMYLDQGWSSSNPLYDRDLVNSSEEHESKSSMLLTFEGKDPDYHNGYAVILSPEEEFKNEDDRPSLQHGLLEFDVHFSSDVTNHTIRIIGVKKEEEDWNTIRLDINPVDTTEEWLHYSVDFVPLYVFEPIDRCIRLGFGIVGIDDLNKDTAVVHIDNIKFDQNGGTPKPETMADGWENMPRDTGWEDVNATIDNTFANNTEQHPSVSSLRLTFAGKDPDYHNGYAVIFQPEETFPDDELPNLSNGVLEFDVHFSSDVTNHMIKIIGVNKGWDSTTRLDINPIDSTGEWIHYSIDFASTPHFSSISQCIRLGLGFVGVNSGNKNSAVIYVDNVFYN